MTIDQVIDQEVNAIEIGAFHSGQFFQEEIEDRELIKKEVAKALDILPNHLRCQRKRNPF